MTTHADGGTSPSVGSENDAADEADGAAGNQVVFGPDAPRPAAPGPRQRSGRVPADQNGGTPGWLQQEIQRRVAARGASDTGRHSRSGRDRAAPGDDVPAPRPVGRTAGEPRRRSTRVPDPYAPDGMRTVDDESFAPEQPFRMPGPAAAAPQARADVAAPRTPPKQWPPADGAAGLPRRVPGTGWTLDRRLLDDTADGGAAGDVDSETRMVPVQWSAARSAGPFADPAPADYDDDLDDYPDDEDEDDDLAGTGLVTGATEVIWRAPGPEDLAPAPSDGAPSPAPYTGARPRRFAGAPTDVEPPADTETDAVPVTEQGGGCPDLDDAPQNGRKRVVLSERRTVAHSVRTVVDVQDPGPVGTMWRSKLVTTQLRVALQVGGVALLVLIMLPALFAAFPALGELSVFGLRVPWLMLGFLIYPFLLVLGWWFVGSAERVEQEFVQEVQDR